MQVLHRAAPFRIPSLDAGLELLSPDGVRGFLYAHGRRHDGVWKQIHEESGLGKGYQCIA